MGSNGLNSISIKKCKIPAQPARHTALQLPLLLIQVHPHLYSVAHPVVFLIVAYTRMYFELPFSRPGNSV